MLNCKDIEVSQSNHLAVVRLSGDKHGVQPHSRREVVVLSSSGDEYGQRVVAADLAVARLHLPGP